MAIPEEVSLFMHFLQSSKRLRDDIRCNPEDYKTSGDTLGNAAVVRIMDADARQHTMNPFRLNVLNDTKATKRATGGAALSGQVGDQACAHTQFRSAAGVIDIAAKTVQTKVVSALELVLAGVAQNASVSK